MTNVRVATRLKGISILVLAELAVLTPLLIWSVVDFRSARRDYQFADTVRVSVYERSGIGDQYSLYREDRFHQQWVESTATLDHLLTQASTQTRDNHEHELAERIRQNVEASSDIFQRIVRNTEALKGTTGNHRVYEDLDKRLQSQLFLKNAAVHGLTSDLKNAIATRADNSFLRLVLAISVFALMLVLGAVLPALQLNGLIRGRLLALHTGARSLTEGDLDYRIPSGDTDEFGELAQSFNTMAAKLQAEILAHTRSEDALRLAASVFTHAREGIAITDAQGILIDVNEAFTHITGYSRAEVLGRNPRILKSGRQSAHFYAQMWTDLIEKGFWRGEIWNRRKSGEVYAEILTISAVRDAHNTTQQYVALCSDITPIKEHEQHLERIAHFDALTGLPNRVLLSDRLHQALAQAQRRNQVVAVVFLDLDGFKAVNDRYGHDAGDHLLIALAARMKEALREGDTIARLGGDEFVAVLIDLENRDACLPMVERLLSAAAQPEPWGDVSLQVSASLGVTFYPQAQDLEPDQLLRQADQAMYQAKMAGRNRYQIFGAA